MKTPKIRPLGQKSEFHDSSLLHLSYLPDREMVRVVLSTPWPGDRESLWEIRLSGVLKLDFECLGDGTVIEGGVPPEIYDVYSEERGVERQRWVKRLRATGAPDPEGIQCVMFASSYLRGWGDREDLEGIRIVCRSWTIAPAPKEFAAAAYHRPRIPSSD